MALPGWISKGLTSIGVGMLDPTGIGTSIFSSRAANSAAKALKRGAVGAYNTYGDDVGDFLTRLEDDFTGVSAIKAQNQMNKDLADYQNEMTLANIGKLKQAYQDAGINPNLMYNSSPGSGIQYPSVQGTAVTGSTKFDKIMSRFSGFLSMIPQLYQATAAKEEIDRKRLENDSIALSNLKKKTENEILRRKTGITSWFDDQNGGYRFRSYPFIADYPDWLDPWQKSVQAGYQDKINREKISREESNFAHDYYDWRAGSLQIGAYQKLFNYNMDKEFKEFEKKMGILGNAVKIARGIFR